MTREQSWGIKTTLDANVSPNHHRICWLPQGRQQVDQVMGSRDASRSFPAKEWVINSRSSLKLESLILAQNERWRQA
jgi:hypothetical protein